MTDGSPPMTHRTESGECLNCRAPMTGATNVEGEGLPEPGDVTVCLYCGHFMEFGPDLKLIAPSDATISAYAGQPGLLKAMAIARLWRKP